MRYLVVIYSPMPILNTSPGTERLLEGSIRLLSVNMLLNAIPCSLGTLESTEYSRVHQLISTPQQKHMHVKINKNKISLVRTTLYMCCRCGAKCFLSGEHYAFNKNISSTKFQVSEAVGCYGNAMDAPKPQTNLSCNILVQ